MNDQQVARINELFHKSKNEGLTKKEKVEQQQLRADYISAIRANMRGSLNQVSILNPDGTITDLAEKDKDKE